MGANADTLNDLKTLARFMRGVQDAVAVLEQAEAFDQVAAEASARVRAIQEAEGLANGRLAAAQDQVEATKAQLAELQGQKPAYLEKLKGEAEAILATAKATAATVTEAASANADKIVADARAERDRLNQAIIDKRKTGATVDAENAQKRLELDAINKQIAAARELISSLMAGAIAAPADAKPAEPAPAPADPAPATDPAPAA